MQIGEQLQRQRKRHEMSQETLAKKLHISRQSISKWENGTSLPSFANVVAISELFEISLDELIKGDVELMDQFEHSTKLNKAYIITVTSIVLAILAFVFSNNIYSISQSKLENVLFLPTLVSFICLMFSIDWRKLEKAINKWTMLFGIIWLTLLLWPSFYDFIGGFVAGWNSY